VVAVRPMAAPAGGGDKVAEREVVRRAGSCVVVVVVVVFCLLKRPKTPVAGIAAAAAGQGRLGPTRLGILVVLGGARGRAETLRGADCSRGAGQLRPEQGYRICLSHGQVDK
jgi:hypothetical protein